MTRFLGTLHRGAWIFQLAFPIKQMDQMDLDKWLACGGTKQYRWQKGVLGTTDRRVRSSTTTNCRGVAA